jgi:maltose-binding protein MalE
MWAGSPVYRPAQSALQMSDATDRAPAWSYQVVPDAERITKAQAMVAADQAPDMWRHNADVMRQWAARGPLLDLTDLMPKGYDQSFSLDCGYCIYKERVFGLPHTTDTSALFYREDGLQAIGVAHLDRADSCVVCVFQRHEVSRYAWLQARAVTGSSSPTTGSWAPTASQE